MSRDHLLPVRLVDGVWISADPAVASPIADDPFTPTPPQSDADPYLPPPWAKVASITADQTTDATERERGIMAPWMPWGYGGGDRDLRQWATPGTVEIGGQAFAAKVTCTPPPVPETSSVPPTSHEVTIPITVNPDDWREFVEAHQDPITVERDPATGETTVSFDAEATCPGEEPIPVRAVVTWATPRRIFAALHPRGYLYALGDTEADARENALSRRDINRDEARSVGVDFPPPETDTAWADELIFVTVSGTTESLRVYVASVDDVIPWCPADLWDSGEVTP